MTAPKPDLYLPVEAQGALRLEAPTGRTLELVADGNTLRLDIRSFRDVRSIVPRSARHRGRSIRGLARALTVYGLTLKIVSSGTSVFELGRDARPNWLARLLGLAPARVSISALGLLLRR